MGLWQYNECSIADNFNHISTNTNTHLSVK